MKGNVTDNGKRSELRISQRRKRKRSEHRKFSIKVIRTSKIENINYLWRITYGYQSLWGPGGLG
jgi:hypothetical protein